jgi:hypothetical protein
MAPVKPAGQKVAATGAASERVQLSHVSPFFAKRRRFGMPALGENEFPGNRTPREMLSGKFHFS